MVLHEKGLDFETHEVELEDKSEEFLRVSPTGKVPVVVVDGDSLYESNVVNQFLDEVAPEPQLMPQDPKGRAYARIWMASADDAFYPAVFVASVGRERGFSEERVSEALGRLRTVLSGLEERLEGRDYLAGRFSLADIAHAGNLVRLREPGGVGSPWTTTRTFGRGRSGSRAARATRRRPRSRRRPPRRSLLARRAPSRPSGGPSGPGASRRACSRRK
jgi:glutathione S-transferase